jgi:acyl carrier protein
MSDLTVSGKVNAIIVATLGVPANDVLPTALLISDLGADQLDLDEIVMALEDEWDIDLGWLYDTETQCFDDMMVGELAEAVERELSQPPAAPSRRGSA